ncbi:hypothetical protein JCM6882_002910 [Rhodosporidiobolus microsporus]
MTSKAPSRQSHACTIVYSRSEYVRRHYLAKHAPKLKCPECESTFTRQDLLLRHVKIFHPSRETPSPSELAEQLDLPPPLPIAQHQNSMDSTSSFNSQASTSTTNSLLGGPLTGSPELMARTFAAELPVPPPADSLAGPARRTATYPLPLSSVGTSAVPYTPYPLPAFTSLPPSSYQSPLASPSSSSFIHHPYANPSYMSSTGSIRGRSHTLPAPLPFFGAQPSGVASGAFSPSLDAMSRGNFVNAGVQTDLLAQQIPLHFAPPPYPPAQYSNAASLPPSQPYYASPEAQLPPHLHRPPGQSHSHFSPPPPLPQLQTQLQPPPPQQHQQQQQQQQQQQHVQSPAAEGRPATAAEIESYLRNLQPEPSPFALDEYNPFGGFAGSPGAVNGVGGMGSPGGPA